jgi:hypothetical protein
VYAGWLRCAPGGPAAREALHTAYHARERTVGASIADW